MSETANKPPPSAPDLVAADSSKKSPMRPVKNVQEDQSAYDRLQIKFMTVDRNYETLKQLTRKGNLKLASLKSSWAKWHGTNCCS